jgi:K+-transporting ATPase ATPase B chain
MAERAQKLSLFDAAIVRRAMRDSVIKLHPRTLMRNPVMFVVEVVAAVTSILFIRDLFGGTESPAFVGQIAAWLWFTVLFANFAEAVAEGRGKAQADALRRTKTQTMAKRLNDLERRDYELVPATDLQRGDLVIVEVGDIIPGDGDVIEGIASVDESAITGESAPVIRESGGDRAAVTGGTRVLSDWIKVHITSNPGETFLDRMIALVEGAQRQKTPKMRSH